MYRRSRKYQAVIARLANKRAAKERKLLEEAIPADCIDLPDFRRVLEITDFDSGIRLIPHLSFFHVGT